MALTSRELKIIWLTGGVIAATVLWQAGIAPLWDQYTTRQAILETERAKYMKNVETLNERDKIEVGFAKIEASFPKDDPERAPEDAFSEDVMYAAQNILPGRMPQPGRVEHEKIEGVPGYEFLTFPITSVGELENIALLLKGFDQKGFLIKNLVVTHSRSIDDPELRVEVTLARIVKIPEDEGGPLRARPLGLRTGSRGGNRP